MMPTTTRPRAVWVVPCLSTCSTEIATLLQQGHSQTPPNKEAMMDGCFLRFHSLFERWLLGSVARRVIAYAHCAVTVVRPHA